MKFADIIGFSSGNKKGKMEQWPRKLAGDVPKTIAPTFAGVIVNKQSDGPRGKAEGSTAQFATATTTAKQAKSEGTPEIKDNAQADAATHIDGVTVKISNDHGLPPRNGAGGSGKEVDWEAVDRGDDVGPEGDVDEEDDQQEEFVSARLSEYRAFMTANEEMGTDLDLLSEQLAMAKRVWTSIGPCITRFGDEIQRADEVEAERDVLRAEAVTSKRNIERIQRELTQTTDALKGMDSRNVELRGEVETLKRSVVDAMSQLSAITDQSQALKAENGKLRQEIAQLSARSEREAGSRETLELARIDLSSKLAKAQQAEAQTRARAIEISIQNENLMAQIPALVAEQETFHGRLQTSEREKAEFKQGILRAQEIIAGLESEIQSLKGQLEAQAFSAKIDADNFRAELLEADRAASERDQRTSELASQLRTSEQARQSLMAEIAVFERQIEAEKRENLAAKVKISEMHLKYTTELMGLDNQREYAERVHENMEAVMNENRRLQKFESLYRSAESQVSGLRARYALLAGKADPTNAGIADDISAEVASQAATLIGPPAPPAHPS